jgi:hypothetical protein
MGIFMPVIVWVVFSLLALSQVYIIYRLVKRDEKVFIRPVLTCFAAFTAYIVLITIINVNIPGLVLIFAMASLFAHTFFGYFMRLYERTKKSDRVLHAAGCFAYGLLAYCTAAAIFGAQSSKITGAIFVWALGIAMGVMIEIMEFAADSCGKSRLRMQKGLHDTDFDLISDVIGSAAAAVYAYFFIL